MQFILNIFSDVCLSHFYNFLNIKQGIEQHTLCHGFFYSISGLGT
jgi:hypothetical protein